MTLAEYIRRDMYIRRQVLPQIDNNLVQLLRNFSVLVSGCLVTVISTAGFVRSEAVPSFGLLPPILTVAISPSVTGYSFTVFTTP